MENQKKKEAKIKSFTVALPMDVYKAAKIAAVKAGVTLRELILDCVRPRVM